ncbi:AmmeMemoRadiSam system protein B [Candidatus Sumerlaeota bacterium]|nr:AmmeMemoRadiSam system protein B [Candidatus Sumerlaeota bacterium]
MRRTRKPAQAGRFYPSNPRELAQDVREYLRSTRDTLSPSLKDVKPIALICPHAGYIYSGRTAAHAYASAEGQRYARVLIAAPSHHDFFPGATIYDGDSYETPLGAAMIDRAFCERLEQRSGLVQLSDSADVTEHSLEVQVPFVQSLHNDEFTLAPMLVGKLSSEEAEELARAIHDTMQELDGENANDSTLLVASSDLYHGDDLDECRRQTEAFTRAVEAFNPDAFDDGIAGREFSACGSCPITLVMRLARLMGAESGRVLNTSTSADVSPSHHGYVVGYAAAMFA